MGAGSDIGHLRGNHDFRDAWSGPLIESGA
jgi:hypothetical protein